MPEATELYERLKVNSKLRGLVWQTYFDELDAARKEDPLWMHDPGAWRKTRIEPLEHELCSEIQRFIGSGDVKLLRQILYQFHRDIPNEVREAIIEINEIRDTLEKEKGIIPAPLELPSEAFIG
jgi:hypothetical protein